MEGAGEECQRLEVKEKERGRKRKEWKRMEKTGKEYKGLERIGKS